MAPFDGSLRVVYTGADLFGHVFTSSDSLTVHINGTIVAQDALDARYSPVDSVLANCSGGPNDTLRHFNPVLGADTWQPIEVKQGDVINFSTFNVNASPLYGKVDANIWFVQIAELCQTQIANTNVEFGVVIDGQALSMEIPEPKTVWPAIPAHPWHNLIMSEVDNVLSPITISATNQGIPAESLQVKLEMNWVDTSGGHVHAKMGADPRPDPGDLGTLALLSGTFVSATDSTILAETDESGQVAVSYTAGVIGGEIEFVATGTIGGSELIVRDNVQVAVPGLTMIPDTLLTVYKKLGGTPNHPGPDDTFFGGNFQHQPDYNHSIREDVLQHILTIVSEFDSLDGDLPWINDASLVSGGLFDIEGHWAPPHNTHRLGRDIDFKTTLVPGGDGIYLAPAKIINGSPAPYVTGLDVGNYDFEATILKNCGFLYPEFERAHYHLRFYPDSMGDCK